MRYFKSARTAYDRCSISGSFKKKKNKPAKCCSCSLPTAGHKSSPRCHRVCVIFSGVQSTEPAHNGAVFMKPPGIGATAPGRPASIGSCLGARSAGTSGSRVPRCRGPGLPTPRRRSGAKPYPRLERRRPRPAPEKLQQSPLVGSCPPYPRDATRDASCDATRKPAPLRAGAGGARATGARGPRLSTALAAGCSRRGRRVCSARPGVRAFPSGRLVVGFRAGPGRGDFKEPVWTRFRDSGEGRPRWPCPG